MNEELKRKRDELAQKRAEDSISPHTSFYLEEPLKERNEADVWASTNAILSEDY